MLPYLKRNDIRMFFDNMTPVNLDMLTNNILSQPNKVANLCFFQHKCAWNYNITVIWLYISYKVLFDYRIMAIIVIKKSYFQNYDANSFRPMKDSLKKIIMMQYSFRFRFFLPYDKHWHHFYKNVNVLVFMT